MAEAILGHADFIPKRAPSRLGRSLGFLRLLARRKPLGFVSLLIIVAMLVVGLLPDLFATHEPNDTHAGPRYQSFCLGPSDTFLCPTLREQSTITGDRVVEGSLSVPLGTDQLGRDIYSRLVYGARIAVFLGFGSVMFSSFLALLIGVSSGYVGGWYDSVIQRLVDAIMALPPLVLLLALPSMIGGPTFMKLGIILGVLGGAGGSRVIRSAVIGLRSAQYLEAARVIGANDARIMVLHVIPNIFGPLMVQATIGLGGIILAESALSFLGFGVADPNRPTWGQMLGLGQSIASERPMQVVWPAVPIVLAVFSYNMLGDALRDLLDPRLRGAGGGAFR